MIGFAISQERANLFMLNTLIQRKNDHPAVYKSMLANIRNVQSVILEYIHATLSSGINDNNKNNLEEVNKVVFNWQTVHEANKLRYRCNVNLSYVMTEKGEAYHPYIKKVLDKYMGEELVSLKNKYEARDFEDSSGWTADDYCPFVYKETLYFANYPYIEKMTSLCFTIFRQHLLGIFWLTQQTIAPIRRQWLKTTKDSQLKLLPVLTYLDS